MDGTTTFLGIPTHNGQIQLGVGEDPSRAGRSVIKAWGTSSLIPKTFGQLWMMAVNMARRGKVTHFAMQHSDLVAQPGWLDICHDVMAETGADVVGVPVPIKDERGLLSMGVDLERSPKLKFRNLSMRELETLPETFTAADLKERHGDLVLNTGLWLCKLNRPWNTKLVSFQINEWIEWDDPEYPEGHLTVEPEDWHFSRRLIAEGVHMVCTKKVKCQHIGQTAFVNQGAWGSVFYSEPGVVRSSVPDYDGDFRYPGAYAPDGDLPPLPGTTEPVPGARSNLGFQEGA